MNKLSKGLPLIITVLGAATVVIVLVQIRSMMDSVNAAQQRANAAEADARMQAQLRQKAENEAETEKDRSALMSLHAKNASAERERVIRDMSELTEKHKQLQSQIADVGNMRDMEKLVEELRRAKAEIAIMEEANNRQRVPEPIFFPWPPPKASSFSVLPNSYFGRTTDLAAFDQKLSQVLDGMGYNQRGYYSVPNGFAVATQLEQFDKDGTSKTEPDRWSHSVTAPRIFSLRSYLSALFTANPGYFRVIVFVVTDQPFNQDLVEISRSEAEAWTAGGHNSLPENLGALPSNKNTKCTALIYEFEQSNPNGRPKMRLPGSIAAVTHLAKAGLYPPDPARAKAPAPVPPPPTRDPFAVPPPPLSQPAGTDPFGVPLAPPPPLPGSVDPFAPVPSEPASTAKP